MHIILSLIIPVYNAENYLPACLESLVIQAERNIEFLIINNGCSDGSERIMQEYASKDPRFRIITRAHGSIADARNSGLLEAKGDYIAFCDSDDTLVPKACSRILRIAMQANADVVQYGYYLVENGGNRIAVPAKRTIDTFDSFFQEPCLWNKLIRRKFLQENNIAFSPVEMGEDLLFSADIFLCSPKVARIRAPLYCYWRHTDCKTASITHQYTLQLFKAHLRCRELFLERFHNSPFRKEAEDYIYCRMSKYICEFALCLWDEQDRETAFSGLRRFVLSHDWAGNEQCFFETYHTSLKRFQTVSARAYLTQWAEVDCKDAALAEFRQGSAGLRYLIRYFEAWCGYRVRKKLLGRKTYEQK